ncbi:Isochorismatase [Candidatus Burkholderia verschuerenii]|uniref:Isochorismatase n=1 Tax=Candidatus Burkholderia verschuerenii TaxID=242163 RepID=A0A0L0MEH8_9BURK|nr:isochorismatase family protein [Candidatus Burkholderia verschuerenii]KND60748.1 Isochorismatase [Candidatus Burkholderia verschuerenii]
MARADTLVVIDMQAKLVPHIDDGERVTQRVAAIVRAAGLLDVPVVATEQNPRGLGATVDGLLDGRHRLIEKDSFDATRANAFLAALPPAPGTLWIAGAEAHVCVLLTAIGLLARGYRVEWLADAVGSRRAADRATANLRAQQEGARLTTVETAIFSWLGDFRHPRFREALALIK